MNLKKPITLATLLLLIVMPFLWAGCGDSEDSSNMGEPDYSPKTFLFAVISDSHVKNTGMQKDTKDANGKLRRLGSDVLSKMNLDFIVHTGDHVNDLYCPKVYGDICLKHVTKSYLSYGCCDIVDNCYGDHDFHNPSWNKGNHSRCPPSVMGTYANIVSDHFNCPYYMIMGNHDDRFYNWTTKKSHVIRDEAKEAWARVFGMAKSKYYFIANARYSDNTLKSYYLINKGGFQLFMLDCTYYKPTDEEGKGCDPGCNDEIHFGKEQLDWLKHKLSYTSYHSAVLFWHTRVRDEEFKARKLDILKIIADDKYKHKIKMVFTGHSHKFKETLWKPDPNDDLTIPFYETTSTVCEFKDEGGHSMGIPNYHLVLLDNATGDVTVLNHDDIYDSTWTPEALRSCDAY